jgi:hypothetical protein
LRLFGFSARDDLLNHLFNPLALRARPLFARPSLSPRLIAVSRGSQGLHLPVFRGTLPALK